MGEQVAAGFNGGVAQLGEHLPCKQGVKGSNPSISIRYGNIPGRAKFRHSRKPFAQMYLENRIYEESTMKRKR